MRMTSFDHVWEQWYRCSAVESIIFRKSESLRLTTRQNRDDVNESDKHSPDPKCGSFD